MGMIFRKKMARDPYAEDFYEIYQLARVYQP
ncbi:hypothetical protein BH09VER1_BH09VER1_47500 [soil metagenome]